MTTLREAVEQLDPRLRSRLTAISVHPSPKGYTARMSISIMVPGLPQGGPAGPQHTVSVDAGDLPDGVTLAGWTRYPDQVRQLDGAPHIEEQIRELHHADIAGVGGVNASRFDGVGNGDGYVSWVIKPNRVPGGAQR